MLLAALAAGLAACVQGVGVDVVQAGGQVQIAVTPRSSSARPCVKSLVIYRDANEATAIWQVTRTRDDRCVSHFTIGVVPDGFEAGVRIAAPVRGVKYLVSVGARVSAARPPSSSVITMEASATADALHGAHLSA